MGKDNSKSPKEAKEITKKNKNAIKINIFVIHMIHYFYQIYRCPFDFQHFLKISRKSYLIEYSEFLGR